MNFFMGDFAVFVAELLPKMPSCVFGRICDFAHVVPWLRWTYWSLLTVISISSSFVI